MKSNRSGNLALHLAYTFDARVSFRKLTIVQEVLLQPGQMLGLASTIAKACWPTTALNAERALAQTNLYKNQCFSYQEHE